VKKRGRKRKEEDRGERKERVDSKLARRDFLFRHGRRQSQEHASIREIEEDTLRGREQKGRGGKKGRR